ncbi:hypothetical protein AT1219_30380 [Vibrio alginolyticus]
MGFTRCSSTMGTDTAFCNIEITIEGSYPLKTAKENHSPTEQLLYYNN